MRVFPSSTSTYATQLVILAERTRRLGRRLETQTIRADRDLRIRIDRARLRLVIKLVILAERTRRLGSRFENLTIPADRDLRIGIDRATARHRKGFDGFRHHRRRANRLVRRGSQEPEVAYASDGEMKALMHVEAGKESRA